MGYYILRTSIIIIIVSIVAALIKNDKESDALDNQEENTITLRISRIVFWIGMMSSVIFGALTILFILFEVSLLETIGISLFFIFSVFLVMAEKLWKLDFSRKDDYYNYTTVFGRKYKIYYNSITQVYTSGSSISIKVNRRKFSISSDVSNFKKFKKFLEMNTPPEVQKRRRKIGGKLGQAMEQLERPGELIMLIIIFLVLGLILLVLIVNELIFNDDLVGIDRFFSVVIAVLGAISVAAPFLLVFSINNREKYPWLFKSLFRKEALKRDEDNRDKKKKRKKKQ